MSDGRAEQFAPGSDEGEEEEEKEGSRRKRWQSLNLTYKQQSDKICLTDRETP